MRKSDDMAFEILQNGEGFMSNKGFSNIDIGSIEEKAMKSKGSFWEVVRKSKGMAVEVLQTSGGFMPNKIFNSVKNTQSLFPHSQRNNQPTNH